MEKKRIPNYMIAVIAIIAVCALFLIALFGSFKSTYNKIVDLDENCKTAEANVEAAMQSRLMKIPDMVTIVEKYAGHEEKIYNAITDLSDSMDSLSTALNDPNATEEDISNADNLVSKNYHTVIALAQDVPEIQSEKLYEELLDEIAGSANSINYYQVKSNEAIDAYNHLIRRFPGNVIAGYYHFEVREEYQADSEAHNTSLVD